MDDSLIQQTNCNPIAEMDARFIPPTVCFVNSQPDSFGAQQASAPASQVGQSSHLQNVVGFNSRQHLYTAGHTQLQPPPQQPPPQHQQQQPIQPLLHQEAHQFGHYYHHYSAPSTQNTGAQEPVCLPGAEQWPACTQTSSYSSCTHWSETGSQSATSHIATYVPTYTQQASTATNETGSAWVPASTQSNVYPITYDKSAGSQPLESRHLVISRSQNHTLGRHCSDSATTRPVGPSGYYSRTLVAPQSVSQAQSFSAGQSLSRQPQLQQSKAQSRTPAVKGSSNRGASTKTKNRSLAGSNRTTGAAKQANQGGSGGIRTATSALLGQVGTSSSNIAPCELENFAEGFKQRRIKLGVTQADVGKALATLQLPGVGSLSQSTICRFESLTLSHNNMIALKPILQAWLETAENQAKHLRASQQTYYASSATTTMVASIANQPVGADASCRSQSLETSSPAMTTDSMTEVSAKATPDTQASRCSPLEASTPVALQLNTAQVVSEQLFNEVSCSDSSSVTSGDCFDQLEQGDEGQIEHKNRKRKTADTYSDPERSSRRTSIAAHEKRLLEIHFEQISRPTSEQLQTIADKLDMDKNTVRIWFCNQRQKKKRLKYSTVTAPMATNGSTTGIIAEPGSSV